MGLEQKISDDLKTAMKAGEKERVATLRIIRSQAKNAAIDKGSDLNDEDLLAIIGKEAKKRKESVEMYKKGGRDDLVQLEEQELEIISTYLPKALSRDEVSNLVASVIQEVGAESMQDMGKVMGKVMAMAQGRADGKLVQNLVREKLGN